MQVFLATEKDEFRKAEPGMWNFMLENCNGGLQPGRIARWTYNSGGSLCATSC